MNILVFTLHQQQFAFELDVVDRIVLAVQATCVPNAPNFILGVINVHGTVIPLVNLRLLLGLPMKELEIQDQFIVCHVGDKRVALWVDEVKQVRKVAKEALISRSAIAADMKAVEYVLKENGQMTCVFDVKQLIPEYELL